MWTNVGLSPRGGACVFYVAVICGFLLAGCGGGGASSADREAGESAASAPEPAAPPPVASPAELFPDGAGRSLVLENCGSCHAVACSAIGQRTDARWDNLKEGHRDKVANMSEEDLETVFAYLKEHFNDSKPEPAVPPNFLAGGCTPF